MSVSPQSNSDRSKSFDNTSNANSDKTTVYYLDFWFDKTFSTREKIRFFSSALTRFLEVTANCSLNFLDCLPLNGGVILIGVAMLLFYKITNENCLIIIFFTFWRQRFSYLPSNSFDNLDFIWLIALQYFLKEGGFRCGGYHKHHNYSELKWFPTWFLTL